MCDLEAAQQVPGSNGCDRPRGTHEWAPPGGGSGGGGSPPASPKHSGLAVTFEQVTYRVPSSRTGRGQWATLLEGVTALLAPGEMTAILGPSGSGKVGGR